MLQERRDNIYEQKADHKLFNEASCCWKKKKKRFDVPLSEDRVVTGYTHTHTETTIQRNERWRMRCVLMLIGA